MAAGNAGQDAKVSAALAALKQQIDALDVSKLEQLRSAQVLGGTANRWFIQVEQLKVEIANDVDAAQRVAAQLAQSARG